MLNLRSDEPDYAFLPQADAPSTNQYGKAIELIKSEHHLAGVSLRINDSDAISENPDRYKQHGFYFNADNCIACHACESACSEKNGLAPHLAFRSVGYIEGGTYPAYKRMNISMACNHCDDPVCLKGCPTRAYTKFAEYGAVLQDPNICFGCGYCTWVCPYNAPQLDPVKGEVEKCNMCVDRLEAGLKPACVSACLAGALDFGVIETTPENREQRKTQIPGFPSPEITHPNIRFQQTKNLPREMTRTDSVPLRYERTDASGDRYQTKVRITTSDKQWNWEKLSSRENPLVIFTLVTQAVVGSFLFLFLGPQLGLTELSLSANPVLVPALLLGMLGIETFALVLSTMHLGKPHRFYRAFNNLRYSPVSREVAGVAVFFNFLLAYSFVSGLQATLSQWFGEPLTSYALSTFGWGATLAGPVALYFMHKIYRIEARPFWNHWQVLTSFYGSMLSLGALVIGTTFALVGTLTSTDLTGFLPVCASLFALGFSLEAIGLYFHGKDLDQQGGEGAASHYEQRTKFGKTYLLRNVGLAASIGLGIFLATTPLSAGQSSLIAWFGLAMVAIPTALIGRALFYVLVIPTTMPGAFFWRNPGFQEHAQASGLADMPQAGVIMQRH